MKSYKSVLSFCLLLVAIRRGTAVYTPLNEKTVCKGGARLVQYTNYFACVCEDGKAHANESECAAPVEKCTAAAQLCGEYATCKAEPDGVTFTCKCIAGYESNGATPPVCVPKGCVALDKKCEGGSCIKKDDNAAQCGCNIGKKPGDKSDCVDTDTNAECKLTCTGEHTGCVIIDEAFYDCGCEEGYEMNEGKCEEDDSGSAFPGAGILNIGLLFIASSLIYVLV